VCGLWEALLRNHKKQLLGCPKHRNQTNWSAANFGHLDILKWLHIYKYPWDSSVYAAAARGGQLETLKWLRKNGYSWNESVCAAASGGGHLETLKWLMKNKCPWNIVALK
jgi:hypothetical protein